MIASSRVTHLVTLVAGASALACVGAASGQEAATAPSPSDSALVSRARIATLPAPKQAVWIAYVERSSRLQRRDRDTIQAELRAIGRSRMVPAPDVRQSFTIASYMKGEWLRGDSARRLTESILSYQTPSGGWSKHVDFRQGIRKPGTSFFSENDGWNFIATIDNNSTTDEIRFLARVYGVSREERFHVAVLRGLEYLLNAQYPNGCWPQVYPLMGGYHDAATFNDDATTNVLTTLRDAVAGKLMIGIPSGLLARADTAVGQGIECVLNAQVAYQGARTIWGQQHDPLTLAPVGARSYEHASQAARESAGVVAFLMRVENPSPRVVDAVRAAAAWFRKNAVYGVLYDPVKGIVDAPGAGPVWPRMSLVGSDRAIFSNRDGKVLYDHRQLTDRATGYAWYSDEPARVLRDYDAWVKRIQDTHDGSQR